MKNRKLCKYMYEEYHSLPGREKFFLMSDSEFRKRREGNFVENIY